MELQRKNFEIFDQQHEMYAEGAETLQPDHNDIIQALLKEGWETNHIGIGFDDMQKLWRWNCYIKRMEHTDIKGMFTTEERDGHTFHFRKFNP